MQGTYNLDSQVVIVAGASSGIGRATAIAVAAAGARVALVARNQAALDEVRTQIEREGRTALAVPTDTTDRDATERLIETVDQCWGRIDALINSVGTNLTRPRIDELTTASWNEMLVANLTAAFNLTQAVMPRFRAQGGGLLIHLSSMAAKKPNLSGIAYQATKAGVVGLAHGTMEEEREHGIRTTVIFPGLTDTPLLLKRPVATPPEMLERALQPEDVAAACLFVLSLPPRAHVPELLIYPSRLRDAYKPG
jgi:NADP-dependent 3-hydroxy acid dehydrogenase YdfG